MHRILDSYMDILNIYLTQTSNTPLWSNEKLNIQFVYDSNNF